MAESSKSDAQLGWIYEGAKALVNREDYLLGKKLDKNFEMYSDAVIKEKESGIDALIEAKHRSSAEASTSKASTLGVNIIRNEDPLVNIKVKEEKLKLEMMENPLVVLKMQKLLKEAMMKKEQKKKKRKGEKKSKEKSEKHRKRKESREKELSPDPDSRRRSTSTSERVTSHRRRDRLDVQEESVSVHRHRRSSDSAKEQQRGEEVKRRSSKSDDTTTPSSSKTSQSHRKREISDEADEREDKRRRRRSSGSSNKGKSSKDRAQRDSHIPEHLRPKYDDASDSSSSSSSDTERRGHSDDEREGRRKYGGYGLIAVKGKKSDEGTSKIVENPYKLASFKPTVEPYKKKERKKLSHEEMERKREEMMRNAKWRNDVRSENLTRAAHNDDAEERDNRGKAANFIRPMLNSAAASMTVEQRLNSQRQGLQRSVGYMEQKFANR